MLDLLIFAAGAVAGVGFSAWRLSGNESVTDTLRRIVPFAGGGPGKTPPR
jgi:hypothetical protein